MIKTYFTTIYRSFFSPPLYADVIRRWKGTGALYLLFLSFLVALLLTTRLTFGLFSVADKDLDFIFEQIPVITIADGEVNTDVERPYDIKLQNGDTIIRFVEKVDLDTVKETNKDVPLLVTQHDFIVVRPEDDARAGEIRIHSLENVNDVEINRTMVAEFWQKGKWLLPLLALPFVGLGIWIGYFIQMLVIAAISYVITAFMKEEFNYATRLRMVIVGFTPVVIVNQLSELLLQHKLNFVMIAAMVSLYFFVMVKTARRVA